MVNKNSSVLFLVIVFSLFAMPVSANISNAGFETGDFTGWSFNYKQGMDVVTTPYPYTWGDYSARAYSGDNFIWQNVNLTGHDLLSLDYYYTSDGWDAQKRFELRTEDFAAFVAASGNFPGPANTLNHFEFDISGYNGVYAIAVTMGSIGGGRSIYLDNFTLDNVPLDYTIEYNNVFWDQDIYYTGEIATIVTDIVNYNGTKYSYYLDLYSANDYLTTFELSNDTESNYYTFPMDWADTSLVAKLIRVTDPYATNEVELAYDVSLFESLYWDTTVAFNKSSYNPSDTLKVTWSGAATGSSVWLQAGDDGEVLESNVTYSGSFTFDVPANTTETYYWVDVVTDGYSQAFAICDISPIPDFFFNYSVAVDQDEYVHGDWVTVTYSTDEPAVIKVFDDTNANIWHYLDVPAAVTNETWIYYIGDTDPYGSFSVLFGNDNFLVSDYYSVVSSTSFVQVVPESMYMYEIMTIWYVTNGSSTLSIKDSSDSILYQQTVNSSSLESISYIPTVSDILTITLSDVPADATDTIIVYWAADPDDIDDDIDDVIDDDVIDDVLEDDETMTEYFDEKFREFAPTAWGIFMLSIVLWLMAILSSFGGSGKRR